MLGQSWKNDSARQISNTNYTTVARNDYDGNWQNVYSAEQSTHWIEVCYNNLKNRSLFSMRNYPLSHPRPGLLPGLLWEDLGQRSQRQTSKIPSGDLGQTDRVETEMGRTNNFCKSFNKIFSDVVGQSNPTTVVNGGKDYIQPPGKTASCQEEEMGWEGCCYEEE